MNRLKVQAVIFDNDGVLVNSYVFAIQRHQQTAKALGLYVPDEEELRQHFGKHWEEDFLPRFWPRDHERMRAAYLDGYENTTYSTFPGFLEYVESLHHTGVPLAVVTNRNGDTFFDRLVRSGFDPKWFTIIQTADHLIFRKPDPRVFGPVLECLKLRPFDVVYVGDAIDDFIAARDAGLHFIGVTTGPTTFAEFAAAGVPKTRILASPSDLPKLIQPVPKSSHRA